MAKRPKPKKAVDEYGFDLYNDESIDDELDDEELINSIVNESRGPNSRKFLNEE